MQIGRIIGQGFLSLGLLLGVPPVALAETTGEGGSGRAVKATLWVEVVPGPGELEPEAIRAAIETELGVPTTSAPNAAYAGRIRVEGTSGAGVSVRYESADGATKLERRVALPVDPKRRALVISWVAGNLVRNEAAELLASLSRPTETDIKIPTDTEAETETPTPTAPQAPAPTTAPVRSEVALANPARAAAVTPARVKFEVTAKPRARPDLGATRFAHAALVSPWVAVDPRAAQHAYYLSFGAGYSHVGGVTGFGLGLLVDRIEYRASGAQISALWLDEAEHQGIAIAGVGTSSRGQLRGAEISGVSNLRAGSVHGVQIAGAANLGFAGGQGTQISGVMNYQQRDFAGAQIVGGLNLAERLSGLQLGTVNIVRSGRASGVQLSGALNVAEDISGLQLSVVNVGRDVRGLQLGIVNVSQTTHGLSLGLFNWSQGARVQPTYFFQTPGYHNVGYRSLSGISTGAISFGYDPSRERARTHFSVGVRKTFDRLGLGVETGYGWVIEHLSSGATDRAHELDLVGTVSVELIPNAVSLFAGGGVALPVAGVVPIEPRGLGHLGIGFF